MSISSTKRPDSDLPTGRRGWANRTVIGAGITSAFGDFAYETTNVILPGFLAVLGVPAVFLGTIEGVADALMSFTKLAAGHIVNRVGHRKTLVVVGYALTPVGQALIALALGWPLLMLGRCVSWFGKGLRGPLRDAIIAEAITPETKGRAFGFHRTMDTLGAILGPSIGVALLASAQSWYPADASQAFRLVFWLTLIPGILSALSFALLVRDDESLPNRSVRFWTSIRALPREFKRYLAAVGIFGIGDFSHSLLILAATQMLTPGYGVVRAAQIAGVLYIIRNATQTFASYPIGVAADRFGHRRVLLLGYVAGTTMATMTALAFFTGSTSIALWAVIFVVGGLYVAVQDAIEPSLTVEFVTAESRSVSFGVLGAVNGVGKLLSSVGVGFLWTAVTPSIAFGTAAALMATGTTALALLHRRRRPRN